MHFIAQCAYLKEFTSLKLHNNPVVCITSNLVILCKEQFSIIIIIGVCRCKMHFRHIGTCAPENLTIKGKEIINKSVIISMHKVTGKTMICNYIASYYNTLHTLTLFYTLLYIYVCMYVYVRM